MQDSAGLTTWGELMDHPGLYLDRISQEVGVVASKAPIDFSKFPLGAPVRILPNHACMTASVHRDYYVVDDEGVVVAVWTPCFGW